MSGAPVPDALRKTETRLAAAGGFFCACVSFGAREREKAGHPPCNVTLPRNALAAPAAAFAAATPPAAADSLLNQALGGYLRKRFLAGIQAAFQVRASVSRPRATLCPMALHERSGVDVRARVHKRATNRPRCAYRPANRRALPDDDLCESPGARSREVSMAPSPILVGRRFCPHSDGVRAIFCVQGEAATYRAMTVTTTCRMNDGP